MSFVLLMVGILATAIGVITVGFGIPINEFSLGNTLIIAGTTALMGGLIVIGLALALRQLGQLAALLTARPISAPAAHATDIPDFPAVPRPVSAARPAAPPRADLPLRAPRPAPRFEAETEEAQTPELTPIPPPGVARPPVRPAPAAADEAPSWRPPRPAAAAPVRKEPPRVSAPERQEETEYDAIWPAERRASTPRIDAVPEPGESRAAEPARPEPVSVLKSGVVDGMAYTLYTDGSIEAELAQGVVRFGSIEELRNHLEKSAI